MKKFISDRELTEQQYIDTYTSMPDIGASVEVVAYLKLRYQWMTLKRGETMDYKNVVLAYMKTHLYKPKTA